MSAPSGKIYELLHSMQTRISDVKAIKTAIMLKINNTLNTLNRTMHLYSLATSITISNDQIPLKPFVKNLGFTLDCHLIMNEHVSTIARTCYF